MDDPLLNSDVGPSVTATSTPRKALTPPVYLTSKVHVEAVLVPIGAPADETPGSSPVVVQVTDAGDPVVTESVSGGNELAPPFRGVLIRASATPAVTAVTGSPARIPAPPPSGLAVRYPV